MITKFYNGRILRDHALQSGELWCEGNKIIPPNSKADREINLHGAILAPGYIDLQINGGFGCDFSTNSDCLDQVCKKLPKYGVTSFLATLITSEHKHYFEHLPLLKPTHNKGANCLGAHLEGPFLNPKQKGAHREDLMENPEDWNILKYYGSLENVKIVTLAPELPGALKAIKQLTQEGIIVSAGHTEATLQEMKEAVSAGLKLVTHLFNVSSYFHHRMPGVIGAALTIPELYCSIICDGVHLYPEAIQIAWKCKGPKLILITDAISALGLSQGVYRLGQEIVEVDERKAYLPVSKQLAGAIGTMDHAVRYFRDITHCSIVEALEAASLRPAELLGINKGNLNIGFDADFVILDENLYVKGCWVGGEECLIQ